jgi:dihydrofolate reductase
MVMGRKTFDSLPGLLPGRRHIVLTRDPDWQASGAEVVHAAEEALSRAGPGRVSVIGGAELVRPVRRAGEQGRADRSPCRSRRRRHMPAFDRADWREQAREDHPAADGGRPIASSRWCVHYSSSVGPQRLHRPSVFFGALGDSGQSALDSGTIGVRGAGAYPLL